MFVPVVGVVGWGLGVSVDASVEVSVGAFVGRGVVVASAVPINKHECDR